MLATIGNDTSLLRASTIRFGAARGRRPVLRHSALDRHRNLLLSAISNPPIQY